jgi:L-lactate dehydrogenase
VGATAAYALVMRGVGREIVMVDKNTKRAEAEADDILHAVPFAHPMEIRAGEYADLAGCSVVIMAAGVNQKPGETRMELLSRNAAVFTEVIPQIIASAPDGVIVVATNPVDVMTHYSAQIAAAQGWKRGRVFGSGTTLDTARFRSLLGRHLGVDSQHIHAYVIGEHGDSSVPVWSMASLGQIPLTRYAPPGRAPLDEAARARIHHSVVTAGKEVIQRKGATFYAVALSVARIVEAILDDEKSVLTVSSYIESFEGVSDVCLSLPAIVGREGIREVLPIVLDDTERGQLVASAAALKDIIRQLGY